MNQSDGTKASKVMVPLVFRSRAIVVAAIRILLVNVSLILFPLVFTFEFFIVLIIGQIKCKFMFINIRCIFSRCIFKSVSLHIREY